jgi:hypothetical protein
MIPRRNYDADALRYLNAVQLADGQALEPEIQAAVDAFVRGCKKDGIWDAIKASCILCGARTISGALVPLVGPSPTAYPQPVNFVSADYDRSSGLVGDGATKYLDSGYAYAQDQDDSHISIYRSAAGGNSENWMGAGTFDSLNGSFTRIGWFNGLLYPAVQSHVGSYSVAVQPTGFAGVRRASGSSVSFRHSGADYSASVASKSVSGVTGNFAVYAANYTDLPPFFSSQRAAFYSIGSSLDLAALDNRISTLVAAIAAAI